MFRCLNPWHNGVTIATHSTQQYLTLGPKNQKKKRMGTIEIEW